MNFKLISGLVAGLAMTLVTGLAQAEGRIVSIGGNVTEMVYLLGGEDRLVGSDTTSYFPPAAARLPKVGYLRALSAEGILSLKPDMVLLGDGAGPAPVLKQLESTGVTLHHIPASKQVDDIVDGLKQVADILGHQDRVPAVIDQLRANQETLEALVSDGSAPPRVLFIMGHGGGAPMAGGADTSVDAVIQLAGAKNVGALWTGYKPLTPEAALAMKPDVILVTDQTIKRIGDKELFWKLPGLAMTPAGKNKRLISMDALLLLGFGPRAIEAASELHRKLHS